MKLFLIVLYHSLFNAKDTLARLTPKRIAVLLIMIPFYVVLEIVNWTCLLLDEIFFGAYRHQKVADPVFVVGAPRSGTTFLHRVLSKDKEHFSSMTPFEIIFAPSIIQKKFWQIMGYADRTLFEGAIFKKIREIDRKNYEQSKNWVMHKFSWFEVDEDDPILVHIFASTFLIFMFPFKEHIGKFGRFDEALPPHERRQIMLFYKNCVKRHLYTYGPQKRFLSKNPAFSCKIQSLYETFPDAKIVCMVRSPLNTVPSTISQLAYYYDLFCDLEDPYPLRDMIIKMVNYNYYYTLKLLDPLPPEKQAVERYGDLVAEPGTVVRKLYERFGFEVSDEYGAVLDNENEKAKVYRSDHKYSFETIGIDREKVITDFKYIFDRFGFDTSED